MPHSGWRDLSGVSCRPGGPPPGAPTTQSTPGIGKATRVALRRHLSPADPAGSVGPVSHSTPWIRPALSSTRRKPCSPGSPGPSANRLHPLQGRVPVGGASMGRLRVCTSCGWPHCIQQTAGCYHVAGPATSARSALSRGVGHRAPWSVAHAAWRTSLARAMSRSRRCSSGRTVQRMAVGGSVSSAALSVPAELPSARVHQAEGFQQPGQGYRAINSVAPAPCCGPQPCIPKCAKPVGLAARWPGQP